MRRLLLSFRIRRIKHCIIRIMAESNMAQLFPTKYSFVIFISYMGLFISQGILVRSSQTGHSYKYSTVMAVLLTEFVKLILATVLYLYKHSFKELRDDISKHRKVFQLYFVPAGLYCLYNNLGFVNLAAYDPTTYFLLLQLRVVVTGVIFQILFDKKLSIMQWVSLIILTIGCIIKEVGPHVTKTDAASPTNAPTSVWSNILNVHLFLIIVQVLCSCFAGVYNEYLLKEAGCDVQIMLQNIFMYIDSIVCNVIVLILTGQIRLVLSLDDLKSLAQPSVIAIILNNAAIGIVTSLFLRSLNVILKSFASALELMFTAVLCYFIFSIKIDLYTIVAIFVVSAATFLYAHNPVVNPATSKNAEYDVEHNEEVHKPVQ